MSDLASDALESEPLIVKESSGATLEPLAAQAGVRDKATQRRALCYSVMSLLVSVPSLLGA